MQTKELHSGQQMDRLDATLTAPGATTTVPQGEPQQNFGDSNQQTEIVDSQSSLSLTSHWLGRTASRVLKKLRRIIFKDTIFAPELSKLAVKKLLAVERPVILEIGCADGLDTLEFLNAFGDIDFALFCFEPDPRNIEAFRKRINDTRVVLIEAAVGERDGRMLLHQSSTIYSSSLKAPKLTNLQAQWPEIQFPITLDVAVRSIDSFVVERGLPTIDFIWADVQGAEDLLLMGATKSLRTKIRFLYTEYSKKEYYEGSLDQNGILQLAGPGWTVLQDYDTDVLLKNNNVAT